VLGMLCRSTPWFPGKPSQSTPIIRPPLRSVNSAGLPESPRGSTNSFSGLSSSVTGVESSGISTTTKGEGLPAVEDLCAVCWQSNWANPRAALLMLHTGMLCALSCPAVLACAEIIEATRQRMRQVSELPEGALVLQGLLGEGTFGKVHSGAMPRLTRPVCSAH
jgi:hypothetical protein